MDVVSHRASSLRIAVIGSQDLRVLTNGVNSHTRVLLHALERFGYAPVMLFPVGTVGDRSRLFAAKVRARLSRSDQDAAALSGFASRLDILVRRAASTRLDTAVDVVHAQDYLAASAIIAAYGKACPPIVLAYHANGLPEEEVCERFHVLPGSQTARFVHKHSRLAFAHARRIVAVSPFAAGVLRDRAGLAAERVSVIENGIALPEQAADLKGFGGGSLRLISVGQLIPRKGFDLLLTAIARVRSMRLALHLTILGQGPEREHLQALAGELRVSDAVTFAGEVGDVPSHLLASDLFVLPSRADNLPMALLEAMAAGLPVIASDVGGIRAALNGLGRLVPAGDVGALVDALHALIADASAARGMGAALRERVHSRYSDDAMARRWLTLYEQMLQPSGALQP